MRAGTVEARIAKRARIVLLAADGASNLGNGLRGVFVYGSAHDNQIGGFFAGAGNVIAFNHDDGVLIGRNSNSPVSLEAGPGNGVGENSIFSNGKLGIELGPDTGVPAVNNSAGLVINAPTLSSAVTQGVSNSFTLNGNWQSNTFTQGVYLVEVFANVTPNASGHGEGKIFLGDDIIQPSTNSTNFSFFIGGDANAAGQVISCTITDPLNNTSEFSNDVTVS